MESEQSSSKLIVSDILEIDSTFSLLEEIPSKGFNRLVIAKRYGRRYLLKALKEEYLSQNLYRGLLRKEFEILISLNHPNIVHAEGFCEIDSLGPCIIMEYIEGDTLKDFLQRKTEKETRQKIADALINAIAYIHKNQIVHRDLKPSNILITKNGCNPKIIDFGLSDTDSYVVFKQPAGTPKYISPEQLQGAKPDCRNDIYSLGKILLELNLGFVERHCAKHCLRPIDKRPANAEALQSERTRLKKRIKVGTSLLSTIIIVILLIIPLSSMISGAREKAHANRINQKIVYGKQRVEDINRPLKAFYALSKEEQDEKNQELYLLLDQTGDDMKSLVDSLVSDVDEKDKSVILNAIYTHQSETLSNH